MSVLITGVAGFIGAALAASLLENGQEVIGLDNINDYYDTTLKHARLERLEAHNTFRFLEIDIADKNLSEALAPFHSAITHVVHLAAQAGVRYSLINPLAYAESNLLGFVNILETTRCYSTLQHFIYASSSSVYGGNEKTPFSISDDVSSPCSLYAATKRSNELIAHAYAHLYQIPVTGLRFFTVYGPWGRPDMAAYLFTSKIIKDEPIPVFNNGQLRRDFTYIDDIIDGVRLVLAATVENRKPRARIYNLGNSKSEALMDYISEIEKALGQKGVYEFLPLQKGDVYETYADITETTKDFGYQPTTSIQQGIPAFVEWYRSYHKEN
jgi:UDP-glucuronate 4-epimerase